MKQKLSRVISIFLRNKFRELTDFREMALNIVIIVISAIAGFFLAEWIGTTYPMTLRITALCFLGLIVITAVIISLIRFYIWISDNWENAKKEAYQGVDK